MKKISPNEMAKAIREYRTVLELNGHRPTTQDSRDAIAQAQLDDCEKEHDADMREVFGLLLKLLRKIGVANEDTSPNTAEIQMATEEAIENYDKDAKMRELLPYMNHREDCLIYRQNYLDALMGSDGPGDKIERGCNCNVDALKEKYL